MIFEQLSNQTNQQLSISHGNNSTTNLHKKFVPGGIETDTRRAWLRTDGILSLQRPEHLVVKS